MKFKAWIVLGMFPLLASVSNACSWVQLDSSKVIQKAQENGPYKMLHIFYREHPVATTTDDFYFTQLNKNSVIINQNKQVFLDVQTAKILSPEGFREYMQKYPKLTCLMNPSN